MLELDLVESEDTVKGNYFDGAIRFTDDDGVIHPLVRWNMQTYEKVSRINSEKDGRSIIAPVNAFFATLTNDEQKKLYRYYESMHKLVREMSLSDLRDPQSRSNFITQMYLLTDKVFLRMNVPQRLFAFTQTDMFIYPNLGDCGKDPHHSKQKTFLEKEYSELTAVGLFCKIIAPIWGSMIMMFERSMLNSVYKEYFSQQIVDGVLNGDCFSEIYERFLFYVENRVTKCLKENDARKTGSAISSFILSRSKLTTDDFLDIVNTTLIVKKLVRYDCIQTLQDGSPPNLMVYVDREIKEIVEAGLSSLRKKIKELPQREPPTRGGEENNTSVIDHISKMSSKTADIPVFVAVAAETWDLPVLLEKSGVNVDHWNRLSAYYDRNPYPVNPLAISLMASFIGKQIKGSRLIDYFPFRLTSKFTAMVQLYMADHKLINLIPFMSCQKPETLENFRISLTGSRILASYQNISEYVECKNRYFGYAEKTVQNPNERGRPLTQKINFEEQITRLISWVVEEPHLCNMPGWFWDEYPISTDPIVGKECPLDESIPAELYKYYLLFHSGTRTF